MRTTIDIPDELFRQAKIRAIQEGVRLKELFARYVEHGLTQAPEQTDKALDGCRRRSDLPIARPARGKVIPCLTNAKLYEILDAEDQEALRAGDN